MVVVFLVTLSTSVLQAMDNPHNELFNSLEVLSRLKPLEAVVEEVVEEEFKGVMVEEEPVAELVARHCSAMDLDVVAVEPASTGTLRRMATELATVTVARELGHLCLAKWTLVRPTPSSARATSSRWSSRRRSSHGTPYDLVQVIPW
jgi:hypothetical protein